MLTTSSWSFLCYEGADGIDDFKASVGYLDDGVQFINTTNKKCRFKHNDTLCSPRAISKDITGVKIVTEGYIYSGAGCAYINGKALPLNGTSFLPCDGNEVLSFEFSCSSESSIVMRKCEIEWCTQDEDLVDSCDSDANVLVITPDYPTEDNLYLSAFAHSRNRRYIASGLNIQVAAVSPYSILQVAYELDGVPVLCGGVECLKRLLLKKQYKAIVVHFVDTWHYHIFDGYITNERLIFICHGPETTFPELPNSARPYFTPALENVHTDVEKLSFVQKYALKNNVSWVFVSQWELESAERMMGVVFKNKSVIHNVVDDALFPYKEKNAHDRKKIMILRRFDNVRYHSVDIAMRCIRELSRRPFFNDLQFSIYGDGSMFSDFTKSVENFENVKIHRGFVPNSKIHELHERHGILLIPSRLDSQGVSMCEAASSGLVAVGSNIAAVPYFMDEESNKTLADPEDYIALANIIERLYYNPKEYLAISERMSKRVHKLCDVSRTTDREVEIIKNSIAIASAHWEEVPSIEAFDAPVLTIIVPAYNLEGFIFKCLYSLLNQRNANKMEVLVINDGSRDATLKIAQPFADASPSIVRIIDKENGGHGSTINRGIAEARGKYLRIIDGDDWVVSENLATQIDYLEKTSVDIMLTQGKHEFLNRQDLTEIFTYPMLEEGIVYSFEDLVYPLIGFDSYGPILSTSTFRTECIREASFKLTEHSPYVDMEYNAFCLRKVKTLVYYNLDIYRYFIGREGQSISREGWKRNYQKHRNVIFNILRTVTAWDDYPSYLKEFVFGHYISQMVDSQVFMYDQILKWEDIDSFMEELKEYPAAYDASMRFINMRNAESKRILCNYRRAIDSGLDVPIIKPDGSVRKIDDHKCLKHSAKQVIKAATPYGLLMFYRRRIKRK